MKLIIAGSRGAASINVEEGVKAFKIAFNENMTIESVVCGGARGPDTEGEKWARANKVRVDMYEADWAGLGKRAGFVRNCDMGNHADGLLAFWDGNSPGTKHMIDYMQKLHKPVLVVKVDKEGNETVYKAKPKGIIKVVTDLDAINTKSLLDFM